MTGPNALRSLAVGEAEMLPVKLSVFRAPSRPFINPTEMLEHARIVREEAKHGWRDNRPMMRLFVDRLSNYPGSTWQERWEASGAEDVPRSGGWTDSFPGLREHSIAVGSGPGMGVSLLVHVDAIRPSANFLFRNGRIRLGKWLPWNFDGLEQAHRDLYATRTAIPADGRRALWIIQAATGKHLHEIVLEDLVTFSRNVGDKKGRAVAGAAWDLLKRLGIAPESAPSLHQLAYPPRRDIDSLISFYNVEPPAVADMFREYLRAREPGLDYSSLRNLAYELLRNFWLPVRSRNPEQSDLALDPEVARWWKTEHVPKRADSHRLLFAVRALYRDIASWATHDSYWAEWATASFLSGSDTAGSMKKKRHVQSVIHQRIRTITPDLPKLLRSVDDERAHHEALLACAQAKGPGETFDFAGQQYERLLAAPGFSILSVPIRNVTTDEITSQSREENRTFWAWAAVHVLHETGIRIEELLELTATALFTFEPASGEKMLLMQIVPSKTDRERVLLVSPELAHVLAVIRQRVRGAEPSVPLAVRYDEAEKRFSPALPYLFQTAHRKERRAFSSSTVRRYLNMAVEAAGLSSGQKLTPHDFRRIFATDALRTGLPVHILAKVMGHLNINTTQGYAAVFDEEVARHFRTFVDARRTLRPAEDYREPTAEELEEFQNHFTKRKVELGSCSRGYGTPCVHEHACVRCPMLRPDPRQRGRLEEIRANLADRRAEALRMGWGGELEGIEISLRATEAKLDQMSTIVRLSLERRRLDP